MPTLLTQVFSQAETEHATGFSREVLRKWELRFGYPQPARDGRGRRLYTHEDVIQLQQIKRLIAKGHRPRELLTLSMSALQALDAANTLGAIDCLPDSEEVATALLSTLSDGQSPQATDRFLQLRLNKVGLELFVQSDLPVLNRIVGDAWAAEKLGVHGEHLYTESVRNLVQRSLSVLHPTPGVRCVLLTTPPGESHGLGLLGLQATLALNGAHCIALGLQTPASSVAKAALDWNIAVVCISASVCLAPDRVQAYVADLRSKLPKSCELWVGGQGAENIVPGTIEGVDIFQTFAQAVAKWKSVTNT
jgi:DNA-binding transcriptional MerR regulator